MQATSTGAHALHTLQSYCDPAVAEARTNSIACDDSARGFLESGDIKHFMETAKLVAGKLKGPDGHLNDVTLPFQLTPLHIACLAEDIDLLRSALGDRQCPDWICQCTDTLPVAQLGISLGDNKEMPAMNHDPALHFALFRGWNQGALLLINALKDAGKLEHTVNNTGHSVLNLAACACSLEVVRALCDHFRGNEGYASYLFHKTDNQSNLLHHATQQHNSKVYEYLERQAEQSSPDPYQPRKLTREADKSGRTPVDYIRQKLGEQYIQQLESNVDLRNAKYATGGFQPWEFYYVTEYLGDARAWIPPWHYLQYGGCTIV